MCENKEISIKKERYDTSTNSIKNVISKSIIKKIMLILEIVEKNPNIRQSEVIKLSGLSKPTIIKYLRFLEQQQKIVRKYNHYFVSDNNKGVDKKMSNLENEMSFLKEENEQLKKILKKQYIKDLDALFEQIEQIRTEFLKKNHNYTPIIQVQRETEKYLEEVLSKLHKEKEDLKNKTVFFQNLFEKGAIKIYKEKIITEEKQKENT